MNQADLNRTLAAITGETVTMIANHGFGLVELPTVERDPLVFDWDDEDARLLGSTFD